MWKSYATLTIVSVPSGFKVFKEEKQVLWIETVGPPRWGRLEHHRFYVHRITKRGLTWNFGPVYGKGMVERILALYNEVDDTRWDTIKGKISRIVR